MSIALVIGGRPVGWPLGEGSGPKAFERFDAATCDGPITEVWDAVAMAERL